MTESEVRKLLRQMKELDSQTAFRDFYNMTYDRLFRIAYYYVKQEEWSQEIVLDVFLKLWKQRSNLLDVRNIEDYCFILVKNASLNYLEKESKHTYIHPDSLPEPQEQSYSPEESLISEELFALYVKALDRLPERCREVFIRIREEKQSYTQVAEELGISLNTQHQLRKLSALRHWYAGVRQMASSFRPDASYRFLSATAIYRALMNMCSGRSAIIRNTGWIRASRYALCLST